MFDRPEKEGSEAEQFCKRPPQLQRQEVMEAAQWGRRASSWDREYRMGSGDASLGVGGGRLKLILGSCFGLTWIGDCSACWTFKWQRSLGGYLVKRAIVRASDPGETQERPCIGAERLEEPAFGSDKGCAWIACYRKRVVNPFEWVEPTTRGPWFCWCPCALCWLLVLQFPLSTPFSSGLQSGGPFKGGFKTVCWAWREIVRNTRFF